MRVLLAGLLAAMAWCQTAKYPGAIATDADLLKAKDRSASTLTADINDSTLSVPVADGTRFVAYQTVTIDDEQLQVCSIAGNTLTICTGKRGFGGTTPASHSNGALVRGQITAWHHNAMSAEIKAVETALGVSLANVAPVSHAHAAGDITSGTLSTVPVWDKGGAVYNCSSYATLQDCHDALPAGGGTMLLRPDTTYTVTGSRLLISKNNVTLQGAGWSSVVKAANSAVLTEVIYVTGNGFVGRDFKCDGNNINQGTGPDAGCACIGLGGSNAQLSRVEMTKSEFSGLNIYTNTSNITVEDSYIHNNGNTDVSGVGGTGVWAGGVVRPSNLRFYRNRVETNYNTKGPDSTSGGMGLDAVHVTLVGNHIENNCNVGGGQVGNVGDAGVVRHWTIIGNTFKRTSCPSGTLWGLEIAFLEFTVTGNTFWNHNGGGVVVEAITNSSAGSGVIANNSFYVNDRAILLFRAGSGSGAATRVSITGNRIVSSTKAIVTETPGVGDVLVTGNDLNDNTTIYDDAAGIVKFVNNSPGLTYSQLALAGNGSLWYCTDCQAANPCSSGGSGAMARREAGAWNCGGGSGGSSTARILLAGIAAKCQSGVAGAGFNLPSSNAPTATCDADGQHAYLAFAAGTAQTIYDSVRLPADWAGSLKLVLDAWSTGTLTPTINAALVCISNGATSNPTYGANQAVSLTVGAGSARSTSTTTLTTTDCSAGNWLRFRLVITADTTALNVLTAQLTE